LNFIATALQVKTEFDELIEVEFPNAFWVVVGDERHLVKVEAAEIADWHVFCLAVAQLLRKLEADFLSLIERAFS